MISTFNTFMITESSTMRLDLELCFSLRRHFDHPIKERLVTSSRWIESNLHLSGVLPFVYLIQIPWCVLKAMLDVEFALELSLSKPFS